MLSACLAPIAAARAILQLHATSVTLPWFWARLALVWTRLVVASASCRLAPTRRRSPALVLLHTNCRGGYHSDLPQAWRSLERTVATAAPGVSWHDLDRFTLLFDDQINFPAECCRASLGFVLAAGGSDAEGLCDVASAWRRHPLVACHGLRVATFPGGDCLAVDMPQCGPLSYLICLLRALPCLRREIQASGLTAKVPGLLEVHRPVQRRITFVLPLEARSELLPF